jgi:NADH-quinone oxidoreductase subunit C
VTLAELAARLREVLAHVVPGGAHVDASYAVVTADVPRESWRSAVAAVRDDEMLDGRFLDLLTAVDELAAGFDVVVRLWSPAGRHGVHLRTRCPREDPRVPTLTGVFGGADWHERETAEMFGIGFDGHPGLAPLLLPDGFRGTPLRKDFVLASRVAKPWPGAKEPGESDRDLAATPGGRPRRRQVPLGVPAPGSWPAEPDEATAAGRAP